MSLADKFRNLSISVGGGQTVAVDPDDSQIVAVGDLNDTPDPHNQGGAPTSCSRGRSSRSIATTMTRNSTSSRRSTRLPGISWWESNGAFQMTTDTMSVRITRQARDLKSVVPICRHSVFTKLRELGAGASGTVELSLYTPTEDTPEAEARVVAIKRMLLDSSREKALFVAREVNLYRLYANQCLNIVRFFGVYAKKPSINVILEAMDRGSLQGLFSHERRPDDVISELCISYIARQALQGLAFLHQNLIIHRDIKPANILVNHLGVVKLADFGIANDNADSFQTNVGTQGYMAPERTLSDSYSFKSDIWSLGLTIGFLAVGDALYPSLLDFQRVEFIKKHPPIKRLNERFSGQNEIPIWSELFLDFMEKACAIDVDKRDDAVTLLKHDFITQSIGFEYRFDLWPVEWDIGPRPGDNAQQLECALIDSDILQSLQSPGNIKSHEGAAALGGGGGLDISLYGQDNDDILQLSQHQQQQYQQLQRNEPVPEPTRLMSQVPTQEQQQQQHTALFATPQLPSGPLKLELSSDSESDSEAEISIVLPTRLTINQGISRVRSERRTTDEGGSSIADLPRPQSSSSAQGHNDLLKLATNDDHNDDNFNDYDDDDVEAGVDEIDEDDDEGFDVTQIDNDPDLDEIQKEQLLSFRKSCFEARTTAVHELQRKSEAKKALAISDDDDDDDDDYDDDDDDGHIELNFDDDSDDSSDDIINSMLFTPPRPSGLPVPIAQSKPFPQLALPTLSIQIPAPTFQQQQQQQQAEIQNPVATAHVSVPVQTQQFQQISQPQLQISIPLGQPPAQQQQQQHPSQLQQQQPQQMLTVATHPPNLSMPTAAPKQSFHPFIPTPTNIGQVTISTAGAQQFPAQYHAQQQQQLPQQSTIPMTQQQQQQQLHNATLNTSMQQQAPFSMTTTPIRHTMQRTASTTSLHANTMRQGSAMTPQNDHRREFQNTMTPGQQQRYISNLSRENLHSNYAAFLLTPQKKPPSPIDTRNRIQQVLQSVTPSRQNVKSMMGGNKPQ